MWLVLAGVGVGIAVSASKSYHKKKIAESAKWQLKMIDDKGMTRCIDLPYMQIDINGALTSEAPSNDLGYKELRGGITNLIQGIVEFKLRLEDNTSMKCSGKIVGQNKIVGNWNIKGHAFGQFELSMVGTVQCHISRCSPTNSVFNDNYFLNFDKKRRRIQGIGMDEAGAYYIYGKFRTSRVYMNIHYFGKYSIYIDGKHTTRLNGNIEVEGTWSNNAGDQGNCRVIQLTQVVHPENQVFRPVQPHQPIFCNPGLPQQNPFNPTPYTPPQSYPIARQSAPVIQELNMWTNEYPQALNESHREHAKGGPASTPFD